MTTHLCSMLAHQARGFLNLRAANSRAHFFKTWPLIRTALSGLTVPATV